MYCLFLEFIQKYISEQKIFFYTFSENLDIIESNRAAPIILAVEDIKDTSILNTNLRKEHEDDKQGILDVRVRMNNNLEIDIEIQISELKV